MSKHVMECVDLDDGGSRRCLGCRQFVHGNLTETPPGECQTPYKSPKQLLDEALAREATLREERELWKGRATNLTHTNADLQQRLTAAEQHNAELVELLREALPHLDTAVSAFKAVKPTRDKVRDALKQITESSIHE